MSLLKKNPFNKTKLFHKKPINFKNNAFVNLLLTFSHLLLIVRVRLFVFVYFFIGRLPMTVLLFSLIASSKDYCFHYYHHLHSDFGSYTRAHEPIFDEFAKEEDSSFYEPFEQCTEGDRARTNDCEKKVKLYGYENPFSGSWRKKSC